MQDVCRGTSSHCVPDFMPGDRIGLYLERIEHDILKNALAVKNSNQTRAAPQLGIGHSGLMRELKRIAYQLVHEYSKNGLFLHQTAVREPTRYSNNSNPQTRNCSTPHDKPRVENPASEGDF